MSNKSKEFLEEVEICKFLLDPTIRSQAINHTYSWMFSSKVTKIIISAISDSVFEGKEIDANYVLLHIKQNNKQLELSSDECSDIRDILSDQKKVKDENIDFVIHNISAFLRHRLMAKGLEHYVKGEEDEAYKYLESGVNFTISKSPFIDPSDEDLVRKLKEMSAPNGRIIKSSLSLYNKASTYGGYKYGDLIMVVAPPKTGKTTLLCQEAAHACKNGLKVAHVCFTGDTLIKTLEGEKTLEELYNSNSKNFKVFSFDKEKRKTEISIAEEVRLMKYVDELLELEFSDGYKVKCTPDHKFLLKDGTYKEAQYLQEEDELEYISKNQLAAEKRWKSKEYREKMSNAAKKNNPMKREEVREKMIGNKNAAKKNNDKKE